jgi:hypothetical protein
MSGATICSNFRPSPVPWSVLPRGIYGRPVDQREATDFAARWERDRNAHDLDALLAHFAPDVVFTSPVAAQLLPD